MTDPTELAMTFARSALEEQAERIKELEEALRQIANMDPERQRADDLGRAARIARSVLNKETNRG